MTPPKSRRSLSPVLVYGSGLAVVAAVLTAAAFVHLRKASPGLFLAPMIGVIEPCIFAPPPVSGAADEELARSCSGPQGSASALVESTLSALAPPGARTEGYQIGYTLQVPLLKLFKPSGNDWIIDDVAVDRLVRTIRDTDRPTLLYLFSTHFGVNAPIEQALQADPRNLAETPNGPLPPDTYYSSDIFNWSLASTNTGITKRRVQAAQAVVAGICKLKSEEIARIRGVTLLGELHQLFPGFQTGMGFTVPYLVSDYSEISRQGFRAFLRQKFGNVDVLNRVLGTSWKSFDEVEPPSKDIRTMRLRDFTEHIDSFAHGTLPIAGWVYVKPPRDQSRQVVHIYRDGALIGKARVGLGRQDVLQAIPEFGTTNTGWRFDMDFTVLPSGIHRVDAFLEDGPAALIHLSTRHVAIMDREQRTPPPASQKALPPSREPAGEIKGNVDLPVDQSSYFYNPLVPLWHAFRERQVVDYLEYFGGVVRASCLSKTQLFTHQIVPFTNPGWDANKYAIGASLSKLKDIRLGVSLYGEPTYGSSFSTWLGGSGHTAYGVTEFHPMMGMDPANLQSTLKKHSAQGAEFVSFFMEPRWKGKLVSRGHNLFSLDPDNEQFGSSVLYESLQHILGAKQ